MSEGSRIKAMEISQSIHEKAKIGNMGKIYKGLIQGVQQFILQEFQKVKKLTEENKGIIKDYFPALKKDKPLN